MALPVVIVSAGGYPMNRLSAHGGLPVTLAAQGLAVTEGLPGLGLPMTFVTEGGSVVLPVPPVTYATFNPADVTRATLSNGNLTCLITGNNSGARSTFKSSGKYYFEMTPTNSLSQVFFGLALASTAFGGTLGAVTTNGSGAIILAGAGTGISIGAPAFDTPICVAVNLDTDLIWFRKSPTGSWNATSGTTNNPVTGVGGVNISTLSGALAPYFTAFVLSSSQQVTANFGASAFGGAVPSGFTAGWPA